ncbi:polymeric immunoglobulin receptor-like [Cyprinus carpio]|uniref:polymeric immunoglobulin receptor-like n=1 Tax=Cyprinus carpio TaxID=7962 RepID=UPI001C57C445|nr:polymeric immunoglobulin receptor-like [Cyprinus carpio]
MRAITIIFITLCLISGQVLCFKVIGCSGGSVMFKCMYKSDEQHNSTPLKQREFYDQLKGKYFCRNRDCTTGISTELQRRWVNNERFTLYDDENSRFFTVFIRNLSREDDGKYICGNNQKWSHDVELEVNNNSSSCGTSVIRSAYEGQTITFSCEYEHKFKTHTKVLYRVNGDPVLVLNSSQSSQSSEEKFILSDSQKDHFTVTIRDISEAERGVYLCGVERHGSSQTITHITFIKEIELKEHRQITSVQVEAYISKSVFITCEFPEEFKENQKFIQKDSSKEISVDEQNQWIHYDKVLVYDDTSAGVLKVFISDLTAADEATYRCAVNTADDHLFTKIKLKISQVDHFRESSESVAVIGESVKLSCNYPEKQQLIKHICKENEKKICQSISSSEKQRFEFSDSTAGVYTASISIVSPRDAGVYWCGAETRHEHLTSVSLTNKHQLTLTMPPVIRREGDSVEIKCPYDEKHTTVTCLRSGKCLRKVVKYLCKGKCFTKDAQNIIRSDEDHDKKPKISVKDDTELNLFTVNMTELRAENAGKYWCAVRDVFNLLLELMIIMKDAVIHEASVRGSASISCKHIRKQTQKLFCRGDQPNICIRDGARVSSNKRINSRFSLTEETSAGVFTVKISDLRAEDSGKYWCAEESSGSFIFTEVQLHVTREMTTPDTKRETSQETEKPEMTSSDTKKETENPGFFVIVVVSVGLLLLALVIALILFKLKHNKHGIISSKDRRQTGDHETTQEDIQDTRHLDPESDPLYSTVELPTNPSDSQNPLYSAVQLPTNPSDGLLYAAVSFQKHEESLSEATVRFSKEETHCDYASVNHNISPN